MPPLLDPYLLNTPPNKRQSAVIAYLAALDHLIEKVPSIGQCLLQELKDQRSFLKMIASENFCSLSVQLAMGNLLTDKYCEGHPFHRFYAGCENVDAIEAEAVELAKKIFSAEHAYVQPHSGADANLVAFWAILTQKIQNKELEKLQKKTLDELLPNEYETIRKALCNQKVMGLALSSGGHLTHGYRHNISAKMMQAITYDVNPHSGLLDYEAIEKLAQQEKPLILLVGYSSYPRKIDFSRMRMIADSIGAVLMVDMAHFAGLVAGKVFEGIYNPIPYADIVTSTTHKTLRGPRGGLVLCKKEYMEAVNKGCPLVLGGPLPHVIAAKAVAFKEADTSEFQLYAQNIVKNSQALASALLEKGATLITGGTDNHLLVMDVSSYHLTGRMAETVLRQGGVTVNRNMIPFDQKGPWYTSGIRIGTAALTTLGMSTKEMVEIADIIITLLSHAKPAINEKTQELSKAKAHIDEIIVKEVNSRVKDLLHQFPLYPELVI